MRSFSSVGGISTFKRYFHCILHAECCARRFWRQNLHSSSQIAIIFSILTETERYFSSVGGISTFKRCFFWILHAECNAQRYYLRNKQSSMQIATIYSILTKIERCSHSVGGISTFKRCFYWILHAECNAQRYYLRNKQSSMQIATIYSILTKIERCFCSVGGISTSKRYLNCILHAECSASRF